MIQTTSLKIADLKIHPKNDYYFDDVTGEKWKRLLESIKNNGVRTPIIVTDNMVVVSGNQRVRACKELGISVINAEIEHYKSDDDVIRDLIEINIRQRGVIDDSEIKAGRRFAFLQNYYGVQQGGNHGNQYQVAKPNNSDLAKTKEQIATESGISVDTMQNCIKLSQMIPEMQDLLDTGIVKPTTALAMIKQLSEGQQRELAEKFMEDGKKVPKSKAEEEIQRIKFELAEKDRKIKALEIDGREREDYISTRELYIHELESREPEVKTVEVVKEVVKEVIPDDYEYLKKRQEEYIEEMDALRAESKKNCDELKGRIKQLEEERKVLLNVPDNPGKQYSEKLKADCIYFSRSVIEFLEKSGGYMYLGREIDRLPETERKSYMSSVNMIRDWVDNMLNVTTTEVVG